MDSNSSDQVSEDKNIEPTQIQDINSGPPRERDADEIDPETLKVGEPIRLIRVRFPGSNKSFSFFVENDL